MAAKRGIKNFIVFELNKVDGSTKGGGSNESIEAEFLDDRAHETGEATALEQQTASDDTEDGDSITMKTEDDDTNMISACSSIADDDTEEYILSDRNVMALQSEKKTPKPQKNAPNRYLLFDDLIATVVDFDKDGAPIVEFALARGEIDSKLPVECGICPDVMTKAKLAKHLKSHRVSGTNRYGCIYCDETYKDYKYLAGHARRHMGIRPYVCDPCKLYFSTKQDLRVHNQRRHQTKEHICEVCGKTFSQNTMLKRHRESTHEKKRRFQCDHCPKAYYKNFSLQEHVRAVHMGKRRMLVCQFCGMQCRDAHKMARHRKQLHLNQEQYVCEVCQEEFTDINYFDAHKRSIQCRNNTRRRVEQEQQVQATHQATKDDGEADSEILDEEEADFGTEEELPQDAEELKKYQQDFEELQQVVEEEEIQDYGDAIVEEDHETGEQLVLQHPSQVTSNGASVILHDNDDVLVYEIHLDDDDGNNNQ